MKRATMQMAAVKVRDAASRQALRGTGPHLLGLCQNALNVLRDSWSSYSLCLFRDAAFRRMPGLLSKQRAFHYSEVSAPDPGASSIVAIY